MIQAVIFDLDGTLIATKSGVVCARRHSIKTRLV